MASNVYFSSDLKDGPRTIIEKMIHHEKIMLAKEIPLKVHFGEEGNETYVPADHYDSIIDLLESKDIKTRFIETNVLYKGKRRTRGPHIQLAKEHGFTRIPITIADGENGESFQEIKINKKHFKSCKIGKAFSKYDQIIICSHFKGHRLAGFGGALKQLAMGCASRGGKLAIHMSAKPFINPLTCKQCHACEKQCPVDAIHIGKWSKIDRSICIGCAACTAVCPHDAIHVNMFRMIGNIIHRDTFSEKLAESAFAAQVGKKNVYLNWIMNVTPGCDCEGKKMDTLIGDIGVVGSTDPVALDQACFDKVKEAGITFKGEHILANAMDIGLGNRAYEVILL